MDTSTVTVPSHYVFLLKSPEDIKEREENYRITITPQESGDFSVTGQWRDIASFLDDLCMGDQDAVQDILETEDEYLP